MPTTIRQWIYNKPLVNDELTLAQFEQRESPIPQLQDKQALIRIKLMNIHSNTRYRMAREITRLGYTDPSNYACAEVIQSRDPAFKEGDIIACQAGWQDYQIVSSADGPQGGYGEPSELVRALNGTGSPWFYIFRPAMVAMWSPDILMEMFGTSGMTAYFGLRECGPLMPRDAVAVAGASGGVGSIAAQLAKIAGCRVVGFAGGADRCDWVTATLGIDRCLDYRSPTFDADLRAVFPDGIDVFSDGIGGDLTDIVTRQMNRHGRLLSYGSAAAFYADAFDVPGERPSFRRLFGITDAIEVRLKQKNIKCEAWIVNQFYHERLRAEDDLSRHLISGALKPISHVVDGFDHLPGAIVNLYKSPRAGKLQVRLDG